MSPGVALHTEREGSGTTLVLVHGFTHTRRCWGPIADALARDHEVVLLDAPGHGRSGDVRADLREGARLIGEAGGPATYVGYSMGARFCLHVGLTDPTPARGLVLLGGTAGIEDPAEREQRRQQDVATSARIEHEGLERFLDGWLAQPLFAGLPADRAFRNERLENTVEGLRSSLELAGTGSQEPSWHELARLDLPVLVLAGADDAKFAALARRMAEAIGDNASVGLVEGAGHAAHLEQPDRFLALLRPWLAEHGL
jgi:2-succinyl-6-hydroxy-2,4-cyclohexadiene-1-carboxylate synthase